MSVNQPPVPLVCIPPQYYNSYDGNTQENGMPTTITRKGQVTIPKHIRDALQLEPGHTVDFSVNRAGEVVLQRAKRAPPRKRATDPFAAVRGRAEVKWRTHDLMKLLRDEP
jgi:antitoxin PrlF